MKKTILFLFISFYSLGIFAQNSHPLFILEEEAIEEVFKPGEAIEGKVEGDGQAIRPIKEVNNLDNADAYPWISADGLKLYFTQNNGSTKDQFHFATRKSTTEKFGKPELLKNVNFEGVDNLSCWLTNDELEIFFTSRQPADVSYTTYTKLFYSNRESTEMDFSEPIAVELIGDFTGYMSGPSLTQDKSQLYLYNDGDDGRVIIVFEQTDDNVYKLVDQLPVPNGYESGAGQLSKDGLSFLVSLEIDDDAILYEYTRTTISDDFSHCEVLGNEVNSEMPRNIHPSMNQDGSILVFARNNGNSWAANDLYIMELPQKKTKRSDLRVTSVEVFPNPASDKINIANIDQPFDKIQIFTIDGKLVIERMLTGSVSQMDIDVSHLSTGVYLCKVFSVENTAEAVKFVVE